MKTFHTAKDFCKFCQDFTGELIINRNNEATFNGVVVAKFEKR